MSKVEIKTPFFVLNPKSYLYGEELLKLAKKADQLAENYPISIFVTAPYADLKTISDETNSVIITAQHIDGIEPGRGMGHVLPESVYHAGAKATFLNHAERPLTFAELTKSIERADELNMVTVVCADSIKEAKAIATLAPDIILCEPTELIGTGQTSDDSYIEKTNEAVKEVSETTLVMQAAGISTADDVYRTISLGADGTGCTSGIVKAEDPVQMLEDMVTAAVNANQ
ncbi:triose-phosphate isomerase [Marinilactibacillus psychrotolerans]|uniref:Triose-phosphate isomerase n=1 Tax=Marinilactibacillus psychrotolerans TaxID=191770 RepID=A0ABW8ULK4_9LACT